MARTLATPQAEDMQGGQTYLDKPGMYLFCVEAIHDGYYADGKTPIANGGLGIKFEVAAGPENGKVMTVGLQDPNSTHRDKGVSAAKKQMAFLIATNVLTPAQANGEAVSYDEQDARAQYFVAEVSWGDKKNPEDANEKPFLQFHYSNIYHIDDPRAKDVEKPANILALIPANRRHDAAWFAPIIGKSKKSEPAPQAALATALETGEL